MTRAEDNLHDDASSGPEARYLTSLDQRQRNTQIQTDPKAESPKILPPRLPRLVSSHSRARKLTLRPLLSMAALAARRVIPARKLRPDSLPPPQHQVAVQCAPEPARSSRQSRVRSDLQLSRYLAVHLGTGMSRRDDGICRALIRNPPCRRRGCVLAGCVRRVVVVPLPKERVSPIAKRLSLRPSKAAA